MPEPDPFATFAASQFLLDRELRYQGRDGRPALCRLRVFAGLVGTVAILTELARNPGMSVTDAAEEAIAAAAGILREDLAQDPGTVVWLEHYDRGSYHLGFLDVPEGERFSRIRIEDGQATWEPLPGPLLEEMIGRSLG
jgi:hypothetical protein